MIWLVAGVLVLVGIFLVTGLFGAPYVPSRRAEVEKAFAGLRPLNEKDVVVDFGCGDGVVLQVVAKSKAKGAVGIELNPILVARAKWKNREHKKVRVQCGNMLMMKWPEDMTVAYIFGLDRVMRMLKPRLMTYAKEHKRDIWVVSLAFEFDGMEPEKRQGAYGLYRIPCERKTE